MSIIKCPKCFKEMPYKSNCCHNCGCRLCETIKAGSVIIKMPINISRGISKHLSSGRAEITSSSGKVLWQGLYGENASFTISEPTRIIIDLGVMANQVLGVVYPRKKILVDSR